MRVGVNTLFLIPGEVGGSETYCREVLLQIATRFSDTPLVLFTNRENDFYFRELFAPFPQVECRTLAFAARNRTMRVFREQAELPLRARQARLDVLWSPGYTAPLLAPCPQVVSILDVGFKEVPETYAPATRRAYATLVPLVARRCRRVLTISEFSRRGIVEHLGVAPTAVRVTYLAAHPAFADTDGGTEARTPVEQMLAAKGPYLLCVANTYPHKNVHTLARAYMSLYERIPHRLVIVGNPGIGEGLVQEALASLRDPGRVVRLRGLASGNLAALYQNADLFVFPSLHEGFGLPVLEAMMAGLPVVTSRKGAIPEVGGDCVRYADPGDAEDLARAVREMLELSGEQRRAWVARARQRAAQFSWEQTADATVACLRDACGNNA